MAASLVLILLAGCTTSRSGERRFTLFPEGHVLSPEAKAVRQPAAVLALPRELEKQPLPPYRVEPGDGLTIGPVESDSRWPDEELPAGKKPPPPIHLPANEPVLLDGRINLGRYGHLYVAGKTVEEIEALIRATIQAQIHRDPGFITVRLTTRDSKVYYVLGEVNNPGVFPLKGRETVLDAVMAAGGLNERGSRYNIILSRPTAPDSCRIVLPVCWYNITQVGDTTTNYQIMPGDRIYVPTRTGKEAKRAAKSGCPGCNPVHQPCPIPEKPAGAHPPPLPRLGPPLPALEQVGPPVIETDERP
jgi:protein involved in polysaccharide export with SLBB domain